MTTKNKNDKPRVTQIVDILGLNKQALIQWAKFKGQQIDSIRETALDVGSCCHAHLEAYKYNKKLDESKYGFDAITIGRQAIDEYKQWEEKFKPKYIKSEFAIETNLYRGTLDDLIEMSWDYDFNTKEWKESEFPLLYLFDTKTSKPSKTAPDGVYKETIVQIGGYRNGLYQGYSEGFMKELYEPQRYAVLHIDKEIDPMKKSTIINIIPINPQKVVIGADIFQALLDIWQLKDQL